MARQSSNIASVRSWSVPASMPRMSIGLKTDLTFPVQLAGRARFAVNIEDALMVLERLLRAHARKSAITAARVRRYCEAVDTMNPRMELAVLHTALTIIKPDVLSDALLRRLVGNAGRVLAGDATGQIDVPSLPGGRASQRGNGLISLFLGTIDSSDGERLMWRSRGEETGHIVDARGPASDEIDLPVGGMLSLEGTLRAHSASRSSAPIRVRSTWNVSRTASGVVMVERAGSFAPPLDSIVSFVGESALQRFAGAVPQLLAGLLDLGCEPTFASVERVLRLGRVSNSTRVYLLYWRRLRDYLVWSARTELAGR